MSAGTYDIFERFKQQGLDARRAGNWETARRYFLEAARSMTDLSASAEGEELQSARRQTAERLLELARDCAAASSEKRRPGNAATSRGAGAASINETSGSADGANASDWMVRERPSVRFADVAGLDEVKENIRLRMLYPFQHPDLAQRFGIRGGGGVLLYGPPGTGKTLLARATAGEIDAAFFRVSPADILSKWVGEAEQNVQKLFAAASAEPRSIIFIDEIEALVPARQDAGASVMQRVVPQILQGMEGFDKSSNRSVLFMGATNVPWQLDPAVLRPGRFDEKVYIPLPDFEARSAMLELYLSKRPLAADVDYDTLAKRLSGYSGADIQYLCDRAATIPFLQSVASGVEGVITQPMLDDAIADTKPSVSAETVRRLEAWTNER